MAMGSFVSGRMPSFASSQNGATMLRTMFSSAMRANSRRMIRKRAGGMRPSSTYVCRRPSLPWMTSYKVMSRLRKKKGRTNRSSRMM